jgi:hypothetical protein
MRSRTEFGNEGNGSFADDVPEPEFGNEPER